LKGRKLFNLQSWSSASEGNSHSWLCPPPALTLCLIDNNLHGLAVMRMSKPQPRAWPCDGSILVYAQLSMVLGPRFGDHRDGFRFGTLTWSSRLASPSNRASDQKAH